MNYIISGNIKQVYMSIFTRYKKLFLVVLFLSVVIFLGYLLWRVFFQEQAITPGG